MAEELSQERLRWLEVESRDQLHPTPASSSREQLASPQVGAAAARRGCPQQQNEQRGSPAKTGAEKGNGSGRGGGGDESDMAKPPMTLLFDELFWTEREEWKTDAARRPFVESGQYLREGKLEQWTGEMMDVDSPIYDRVTGMRINIGRAPKMDAAAALAAVDSAVRAWNHGRGEWALASIEFRLERLIRLAKWMEQHKTELAHLLMWEVCKLKKESEKEIERTVQYVYDVAAELRRREQEWSRFRPPEEHIRAHVRLAPLGVCLCMGPFNYPINEAYASFIPALALGNVVVLKAPSRGILPHLMLLPALAECFPPGVVNVITGPGRDTISPVMKSGKIDLWSFIGTGKTARMLLAEHPNPIRLRPVFGLEAKNPAVVLPDIDWDQDMKEIVRGCLSFNGQRCTALKILFVHQSIVERFLRELCRIVDDLRLGMPWDDSADITPVAEEKKPKFLRRLIDDALAKGAIVANSGGNQMDRSFCRPTVLYPVTRDMSAWHEEQYGPLVPVARWERIEDIVQFVDESRFGLQASIFGKNEAIVGQLVDALAYSFGRININAQSQRGPDTVPFSGRKDSAVGSFGISEALEAHSMPLAIASTDSAANDAMLRHLPHRSLILRPDARQLVESLAGSGGGRSGGASKDDDAAAKGARKTAEPIAASAEKAGGGSSAPPERQ
jgi:glyceraldehyde-3-phosphate dehydrogenase (NADP+)